MMSAKREDEEKKVEKRCTDLHPACPMLKEEYGCDHPATTKYCPKVCGKCGGGEDEECIYRGNVSTTKNGHICQEWTSQNPNEHNRTPEKYVIYGNDFYGNTKLDKCLSNILLTLLLASCVISIALIKPLFLQTINLYKFNSEKTRQFVDCTALTVQSGFPLTNTTGGVTILTLFCLLFDIFTTTLTKLPFKKIVPLNSPGHKNVGEKFYLVLGAYLGKFVK